MSTPSKPEVDVWVAYEEALRELDLARAAYEAARAAAHKAYKATPAPKEQVMSRPTWDTWLLNLAEAVATRADCTRSRVGAVLMRPDHTIASVVPSG